MGQKQELAENQETEDIPRKSLRKRTAAIACESQDGKNWVGPVQAKPRELQQPIIPSTSETTMPNTRPGIRESGLPERAESTIPSGLRECYNTVTHRHKNHNSIQGNRNMVRQDASEMGWVPTSVIGILILFCFCFYFYVLHQITKY